MEPIAGELAEDLLVLGSDGSGAGGLSTAQRKVLEEVVRCPSRLTARPGQLGDAIRWLGEQPGSE